MLKAQWLDSVKDIPEKEWNRIFGTENLVKTHGFQAAVEEADLEGVRCCYLVISDNDHVKAIIPCFSFRVKLDTFGEPWIKTLIRQVRGLFPTFLTKKIFFLGSPAAICDHLWGLDLQHDKQGDSALIETIFREVKERSLLEKCGMVILKEIPAREKQRFASFFKDKFTMAESLPNSFMPVNKKAFPFPSALRTRYRRRIKRALRDFNHSGYAWVVEDNYGAYAEEISNLYLQVLEKSSVQFERLNPDFFRNIHHNMRENTFALLCFNQQNKMVCAELVFEETDALIPLYLGIDYAYRDEANLYFNCINRIIEEAEHRNKRWVKFGQTSYLAKAYAGSVFERLYIGVFAHSRMWQFFLKHFLDQLFPICELPMVRCYRDDSADIVKQSAQAKGIYYEPIKTLVSP